VKYLWGEAGSRFVDGARPSGGKRRKRREIRPSRPGLPADPASGAAADWNIGEI